MINAVSIGLQKHSPCEKLAILAKLVSASIYWLSLEYIDFAYGSCQYYTEQNVSPADWHGSFERSAQQ